MAAVAAIHVARKRAKEKENQGYMISSPGPEGKVLYSSHSSGQALMIGRGFVT